MVSVGGLIEADSLKFMFFESAWHSIVHNPPGLCKTPPPAMLNFIFSPSFLSFCSEDLRRFLPITVLVSKVSLKGARGGWRLKISTERKAIHFYRNIFIQCKCKRNAGKCIFNERFKTIRCWETSLKLPKCFGSRHLLHPPLMFDAHAQKNTHPLLFDMTFTTHCALWKDLDSFFIYFKIFRRPNEVNRLRFLA